MLFVADQARPWSVPRTLKVEMKPERRSIHRGRPQGLSYIQFEPEGGGIVLNASAQGLAFHAAAAVRHPGPIRLCISPNPMHRIELIAEIVWMDETKKFGGLRFTGLAADSRNQIRQWLTQTSESETPDRKFVTPSCSPKEETDPCSHPGNGTPDLLSPTPAPDNATPTGSDSATISLPRFSSIPATALLPAPFSQEKRTSIPRPRLLRGLATGFLILVFVFMPVLFLQNFRREIGSSLIRIGEKLKGNGDSQPDASSSIPVHISNPSSESTSSVANPTPETPAGATLDQADPGASIQTTQGTVNSTDTLRADRQYSHQHLADVNSRGGRSALVQQLWSAVEAGDTSAEVTLAQLYLTGNGVPRNCEQSRVLLRAASKNGNSEALQQLRKFKNSACR